MPWPLPAPPPVKARSVSLASPGPFTTQPMMDSDMGVAMCFSRSSSVLTVSMTLKPWRAQLGQETMFTPRWRRFSDFRMSKPTRTSSTGSADSETRMVSPMPPHSSMPMPMEDLTVPLIMPPASVMPTCRGQSIASLSA